MALGVEYDYDKESETIFRCLCGDVFLENNIETWNELFSKYDLSKIKGIINDFSNANMRMEISEISTLLEFLNSKLKNLPHLKIAVLSIKPEIVVFPTLAANNFPLLNIRPFSTIEAAKMWILS